MAGGILVFGIIFILFLILYHFLQKKGKSTNKCKQINGPGLIETFSGLLKMKANLFILFSQWAQKYGPIFCLHIGLEKYYIINDANLIKETFATFELSGRPSMPPLDPLRTRKQGILTGTGKEGLERRAFAMTSLKKFGFGRSGMGQLVANELGQVMANFEDKSGQLVWMKKQFFVNSMNALWIVLANRRFTFEDDSKLIDLFTSYVEALDELTLNPAAAHPSVLYYLPWLPVWRKFKGIYEKINNYFEKLIDEHSATIALGEPRDVIDAFLEKNKNSSSEKNGHLPAILFDYLTAGSDTSSVSMEWAVQHLARNPQVQNRIRKDIHQIIGRDRLPTVDDRSSLPSVEALIWEVLRFSSPVSLGVPHLVIEDIEINGYFFPKGTNILTNLYWTNHNPEIWPQPEEFQPERFLKEGKFNRQALENLIPFSTGKRACLGVNLAMDTLFLFLTGLIQRFEISAHPDYPLTLDTAGGMLMVPKNFPVVFNPVKGK